MSNGVWTLISTWRVWTALSCSPRPVKPSRRWMLNWEATRQPSRPVPRTCSTISTKGSRASPPFPDVIRLEEEHFTKHGLPVPVRFQELNRQNQFFWLRFPITLFAPEDMPFNKLECAVEFNPGVADGYLRPRAQMILPDRKFKQASRPTRGFELRINENFEFEAGSPKLDLEAGDARRQRPGRRRRQGRRQMGFVAGPFTYRLKKAIVDHSPVARKVLWRLTGAEFFQEDDPTLIVVLQVPRAVKDVKIAAALQAYHQFNPWTSALGKAFRYLTKRDADFFSKGAPLGTRRHGILPRPFWLSGVAGSKSPRSRVQSSKRAYPVA